MSSSFYISSLLCLFLLAGCSSSAVSNIKKTGVMREQALAAAVEFSGNPAVIKEVHRQVFNMLPKDAKPYLEQKLGKNNLSCFLLTADPGGLADYEFQFNPEKLLAIMMRMAAGESVVLYEDLSMIEWQRTGSSTWNGSFAFDAGRAFRGKCLFVAEQTSKGLVIQRVVIMRKRSMLLRDGYTVFELTAY